MEEEGVGPDWDGLDPGPRATFVHGATRDRRPPRTRKPRRRAPERPASGARWHPTLRVHDVRSHRDPPELAGLARRRFLSSARRSLHDDRVVLDDAPVVVGRILRNALAGGIVDPAQTEALLEAALPLEVVEQRPREVPGERNSDL